jgi:hypothetical protein
MTGGQGVQKSWRCDHRPVRRNWSLHNEHFGAESVHPHRQVTDLMAPALAPDRCRGGWIWEEKDPGLGETLVTRPGVPEGLAAKERLSAARAGVGVTSNGRCLASASADPACRNGRRMPPQPSAPGRARNRPAITH